MLLDSNILIYAANGIDTEIEGFIIAEGAAVASITKIEVYGFAGLKPEEEASLDVIFARLTIHPLDESIIERAISVRRERKIRLADANRIGSRNSTRHS